MKNKLLILVLLSLAIWVNAEITLPSNAQVYISVNVTGFVANPGTYQLTPINRLSDALNTAGIDLLRDVKRDMNAIPPTELAMQDSLYRSHQALRSVKLIRGKDTHVCDLLSFYRNGDLAQNPLLRDEDVILVSPIRKSVSVMGEVFLPGEYEYLEGDALQDILELAQGTTQLAQLNDISIYRYTGESGQFNILHYNLKEQQAAGIILQDGDRVIINQNSQHRLARKVTIEGQVLSPGEYLIGEDTTLYEILQRCGGPTFRGDIRNALYARWSPDKEPDAEFERLKELTMTQMTAMEYQYLINGLRQHPGRYAISLYEVWANKGTSANMILSDGDYIFVPEIMDMVDVRGQVVNPGLVPWIEGKTWDYYIQVAGGYTNNKRWNGTRIISAASGNWLKPSKKAPLNPGDTVFVTAKTESNLWSDVKEVLLVATQLVTVFLGIRAITTN